jgi:hypothetical protein
MSLKKTICELVDDPVVLEAISRVRLAHEKNFSYRSYCRPKEVPVNPKIKPLPHRPELSKFIDDASSHPSLNRKENKSESRISTAYKSAHF